MVGGINVSRVAARLQINLLDAEPGYFYQGTYLGTKKVVSFGGFYDFQDTVQVLSAATSSSICRSVPASSPRRATSCSGMAVASSRSPSSGRTWARWATSSDPSGSAPSGTSNACVSYTPMPDPAIPSEDRYGGGLAFWPYGHNSNFKVFFLKVHRNPAPHDYNQINVQWQVYVY